MENCIKDGYDYFNKIAGSQYGSEFGNDYVNGVKEAIDQLERDMNQFKGYGTSSGQLSGDVAEFWHSDTFNINARLNNSKYSTNVDRSHDYASADITSNWDEKFGLKYYKTAAESAKAQSVSQFEKYCEYKATSGNYDLTFEQFLKDRGLDETVLKFDPIYSGQTRIIPSDQLKEAIEYLKLKIAKEEMTRPELAEKYRETLKHLSSKIKSPDGTESIELTKEEAKALADIAKDGRFKGSDYGFTTEDLIKFEHILKQGVNAGITSAMISMVISVSKEVYHLLEKLIREGKIDENQFQKIGFAAIEGAASGFIKGFISASLTTACKSGVFGSAAKSLSPGTVAALTVIFMETIKDSFNVATGKITEQEFAVNFARNTFVTGCSIGMGVLFKAVLPAIPGSYFLGSFIGSVIGSFAFNAADEAIMSLCIANGYTFFGLVKQDYTLPVEVLKEIGVDVYVFDEIKIDEPNIDWYQFDEYKPDFIRMIKRGVIGVHQVGYIEY